MSSDKYVLLVEPDFPYPNKSKHRANSIHKNFAPIGLLKLGAYYKSLGYKAKLLRGKVKKEKLFRIHPEKILITSLFTYWSSFVWDTVKYYREVYPDCEIWVGGIYVTLHHHTEDFKQKISMYKINFHVGVHPEAEKCLPDYSLMEPIEYHITHGMRGCIRRCAFCGTWRLEPKMTAKTADQLIDEIKAVGKNRVIFYDNNFFANPNIKTFLERIPSLRINGKPVIFESQSGFDGRLLENDPSLAKLIKNARFENPRIAWDHGFEEFNSIKKEIQYLMDVGYSSKNIFVFMIYNFDVPFQEMVKKLNGCHEMGVQVVDCRFRPLELTSDGYNWRIRSQAENEYYIHRKGGWNDRLIRTFRRMAREQNIGLRYGKNNEYIREMEKRYHPIKALFKAYGIVSMTPKLKQLDRSRIVQNRVRLLKKAYTIYKKKEISIPNLSELKPREISHFLAKFIRKYQNT
jgi:hypothetical protein